MAQEHKLKTLPRYYDAVARGEKNFEVRRDDRGFQKGDILILQRMNDSGYAMCEVDTDLHGKPRFELRKRIVYILTGGQLGIEPAHVVMALENEHPELSH